MILFRGGSGYGVNTGCIHYKSIWNVGEINSEMMFLVSTLAYEGIAVAKYDGKDIEIFHYPHNGKDFVQVFSQNIIIRELEFALVGILHDKINQEVPVYIGMENGLLVTFELNQGHFSGYAPQYSSLSEYSAFTYFHTKVPAASFPSIYLVDKGTFTGDNEEIFRTLVYCARSVMPPASKVTNLGKVFVHSMCLFESGITTDKLKSPVSGIPFPYNANPEKDFFQGVDVKELEAMAEKSKGGPIRSKDGVKAQDVSPQLAEVQKLLLEKHSIQLSTLLEFGIQETMDANPVKDVIVNVDMDIANIAKKICLFEGRIYILPTHPEEEFDYETFMMIPDQLLVVCTDETFPYPFINKS